MEWSLFFSQGSHNIVRLLDRGWLLCMCILYSQKSGFTDLHRTPSTISNGKMLNNNNTLFSLAFHYLIPEFYIVHCPIPTKRKALVITTTGPCESNLLGCCR